MKITIEFTESERKVLRLVNKQTVIATEELSIRFLTADMAELRLVGAKNFHPEKLHNPVTFELEF